MNLTTLSLESFSYQDSYCSQVHYRRLPLVRGVQDAIQEVDRILSRTCLCWHDIKMISFLYGRIDHLQQGLESEPQSDHSPLAVLVKVQDKIKEILSAPNCPPESLINLYYLSRFSQIAPLSSHQLTQKLIDMRRIKGGLIEPAILACHLPYCVSEAHFAEDLKFLIGAGQDDDVKRVIDRPTKILQLDARLRAERNAFIQSHGSDAYPAYLDELLEGGFLYLFEHLLKMIQCSNRQECDLESKKIDASTLAQILLEARCAIINRVQREIPSDITDIVFLVGNTGSGKSTTLAFWGEEPLKRKGSYYELSTQGNLIGHGRIQSQTFLPNVKVIDGRAYVDFSGFRDTRGFVVDLGVELAFKALVALYHPKIVVIESIMALQASRGGHVSNLGQDLKRLLGSAAASCQLVLTQYLQMREFGDLEGAEVQNRRLKQDVELLKQEIQKREDLIFQIQGEIRVLIQQRQDSASQKTSEILHEIKELQEEIQEFEKEISDLEERKKNVGSLNSKKEKSLQSKQSRLASKQKKLKDLHARAEQTNSTGHDLSGEKALQRQLRAEIEGIQAKREELQTRLEEVAKLEKDIQIVERKIQQEEEALLQALGIENLSDKILRLDDLHKPQTLHACQQVLCTMKKVYHPCRELRLEDRIYLIELLTSEFASRKLPPPKEGNDIRVLRSRILETSLIHVLTLEVAPEIGQCLHLAEMDPECIKTMDRNLVEQFIDVLIRLIVTAPVSMSDPAVPPMPIGELMRNFITAFPEQFYGSLQSKWDSFQKTALSSSRKGASTWKELEENYRSDSEVFLRKIRETKGNHLKEWDDWARKRFGIPIQLTEWIYRSRAERSADQLAKAQANKLRDELLKKVEKFNESFQQVKDLEKIITHRDQIDQVWETCRVPKKLIDKVREIYNQGAENEQAGPWDHRVDAMVVKMTKTQYDFDGYLGQVRRDDFLIDLMQLEITERDQLSREGFVMRALELAEAVDKKNATEALTTLAAINAVREVVEKLKTAFGCRTLGNWPKQPEARIIALKAAERLAEGKEAIEKEAVAATAREVARLEEVKAAVAYEVANLEASEVAAKEVGELGRFAYRNATKTVEALEKWEVMKGGRLVEIAASAENKATNLIGEIIFKWSEERTQVAEAWKVLAQETVKAATAWRDLAEAAMTREQRLIKDAILATQTARQTVDKALMKAAERTEVVAELEETLWYLSKKTLLGQTLFVGWQEVGLWRASFLERSSAEKAAAALQQRAKIREEKVPKWIYQKTIRTYNDGLVKDLDLDLGIALHRTLLLAVLDKQRN